MIAGSGLMLVPVLAAANTLAASPTLQSLLGVQSAQAALLKMFTGETDEHADSDIRPRVLLDFLDGGTWERSSTTFYLGNGTVECVLEIPTPETLLGDDQRRAAREWFYQAVGNVLMEMMANSVQANGDYLNVITYTLQLIGRADPKENDGPDFWVCVLDLVWKG